MKILALDSSTSTVSIAFLDDEKVLFEYHQPQQRTNSSIFFEGLQTALQKCGKPNRLVVGLGPGSYNGLRISIAAAQGIASACNIDLIGLPSILGLAAGMTECWVAGDARGGQYWLAALSRHQLLEEPFLLPPADLSDHLKKHPKFPLVASQELSHLSASVTPIIQTPNAAILARLGKDAMLSTSSTSLTRIFHDSRDEKVAKADVDKEGDGLRRRVYVSYCPRSNPRLTQYTPGSRKPQQTCREISWLEPLYLKPPHITMPQS